MGLSCRSRGLPDSLRIRVTLPGGNAGADQAQPSAIPYLLALRQGRRRRASPRGGQHIEVPGRSLHPVAYVRLPPPPLGGDYGQSIVIEPSVSSGP